LEKSFDDWIDGLLYVVCASEEFRGEPPSRFLPRPVSRSYDSFAFWSPKNMLIPLDQSDVKLAQCAQAIALYAMGTAERKIAYASMVSSGSVHRLAIDVPWVLDGLHKLTTVPELGCSQTLGNKIALLARRVRWGAPAEALDVIRIAQRHGVPGFGRQRAMALIAQGIATLHDILVAGKDKLVGIVRNDQRAQALIDAVSSKVELDSNRLTATHIRVAKTIGIDEIVLTCNRELGVSYEKDILELLQVENAWMVTARDNGDRQNVPNIMVQLEDLEILIECKTCSKSPPLIKKEEAWAIIQKAADFDSRMKRVTLGKPAFEET